MKIDLDKTVHPNPAAPIGDSMTMAEYCFIQFLSAGLQGQMARFGRFFPRDAIAEGRRALAA